MKRRQNRELTSMFRCQKGKRTRKTSGYEVVRASEVCGGISAAHGSGKPGHGSHG